MGWLCQFLQLTLCFSTTALCHLWLTMCQSQTHHVMEDGSVSSAGPGSLCLPRWADTKGWSHLWPAASMSLGGGSCFSPTGDRSSSKLPYPAAAGWPGPCSAGHSQPCWALTTSGGTSPSTCARLSPFQYCAMGLAHHGGEGVAESLDAPVLHEAKSASNRMNCCLPYRKDLCSAPHTWLF